jgi:hypothetical protein
MSTVIDGIGASEALDTSGEIVDVKGIDITSLVGGVFNWEHKKDLPTQVVGKILKAKKIFGPDDCENEREAYFWAKCQVPFVYVLGELLDDYTDVAKHLAGIFKYDFDHRNQTAKNIVSFSIEWAKIPGAVDGMRITRSIARKVTICVDPANQTAAAEMIPGAVSQTDEFENIFKSVSGFEIELIKSEDAAELLKSMNMPVKSLIETPTVIGQTKSGKDVNSHGRIGDYKNFSSLDHREAAEMHREVGHAYTDAKSRAHHAGKANLHMRELKMKTTSPKIKALYRSEDAMDKTLSAGMPGAPGTNVQGSALQSEQPVDLKKIRLAKIKDKLSKKKSLKKSIQPKHAALLTKQENQWLNRAKSEYMQWPQRADFIAFMSVKNPSMTKSEVDAYGQVMALKQASLAEAILNKLSKREEPNTYHAENNHGLGVSSQLSAKGKELGQTGSSYSFSEADKGSHSAAFKNKESADKFHDYAKSHPAAHSVQRSEGHRHYFVDVKIKPKNAMKLPTPKTQK